MIYKLDDYILFHIFSFIEAEYNYSIFLDEPMLKNKEYKRHIKYNFNILSYKLLACFSPLYYLYFISIPRNLYVESNIQSQLSTYNATKMISITNPYFYDFDDYIKYFKQFDDALILYNYTTKHKFTPIKYSRLVNSLILC